MASIDPLTSDQDLRDKYFHDKRLEFEMNCNAGSMGACFSLGEWWQLFGKDANKAQDLYTTTCIEGKFGNACFNMAKLYLAGKVDDASTAKTKGVEFLDRACAYGNSESCGVLGSFKLLGEQCDQDVPEAQRLFKLACEENDSKSCFKLGRTFLDGETKHGVPRDAVAAFPYMKKACELGDANGCQILAVMYAKGDGVEKNTKFSKEYKDLTLEILEQTGGSMKNTKPLV